MEKHSEAEVTKQVTDYMEARGWRLIRMNRGFFQRPDGSALSFGEPGMPDYLALHYRPAANVWIEMKRPAGAKPRCICLSKKPRQRCTACDQARWQLEERARGGTVWIIDGLERLERYLEAGGYQEAVQRQQEMKFVS